MIFLINLFIYNLLFFIQVFYTSFYLKIKKEVYICLNLNIQMILTDLLT